MITYFRNLGVTGVTLALGDTGLDTVTLRHQNLTGIELPLCGEVRVRGLHTETGPGVWMMCLTATRMATCVILAALTCGLVSVCQSAQTTRTKPCSQSATCGKGYCCVALNQPRGKRGAESTPLGTCRPLGKTSNSCLVSSGPYDPTRLYYACPCAGGLVCKGTGLIEVPLGERGICESTSSTPAAYDN
ncbi:uncharacterized protein LOC112561496 [Pomacea canaliculata]|uniref:uncharacterized protein LOC112561496 n=1 Tax=Pomacea canaliculata TaxID=400727 RepID=UPI000D726B6D|nr:uncharacterized protein LOC112561496 [Pomacea canaliculata]